MNCFKRFTIVLVLLILPFSFSLAEDNRIAPAWPVPDYAEHLIQVASEEVGYTEDHGRTKYGAWAGDPAAQWCAEFLCWCVDQVDQRWGTALLRNVYPFYTSSNTGRNFFVRAGRYVVRKGRVDGWGYQWMKGKDTFIQSGDYVPQPGDWVFFNWGGGTDTEHVALVEYCTEDRGGNITVHVIEGNNPSTVARNTYELNSSSILGYGTVREVADTTMVFGNQGGKGPPAAGAACLSGVPPVRPGDRQVYRFHHRGHPRLPGSAGAADHRRGQPGNPAAAGKGI